MWVWRIPTLPQAPASRLSCRQSQPFRSVYHYGSEDSSVNAERRTIDLRNQNETAVPLRTPQVLNAWRFRTCGTGVESDKRNQWQSGLILISEIVRSPFAIYL